MENKIEVSWQTKHSKYRRNLFKAGGTQTNKEFRKQIKWVNNTDGLVGEAELAAKGKPFTEPSKNSRPWSLVR